MSSLSAVGISSLQAGENVNYQQTAALENSTRNHRSQGFQSESAPKSFKKAHGAIFTRPLNGKLTLAIRKGYNALIQHAQACGVEKEEYVIDGRTFLNQSQSDSRNYEFLKDLGRRYVGTTIEWDIFSDEGRRRWGVATLLSRWEIIDGKIYYAFDSKIKRQLLNPETYARISLSIQCRFHSAPALALYEVALRYATNPSGTTQRRPWEDWRQVLCGEKSSYHQEFKYFNRILGQAMNEVNEISDLVMQCLVFKNGRTVTHLQFRIERKRQHDFEFPPENIVNSSLADKLIKFGLNHNAALKVVTDYDDEAIEAALSATSARAQKKNERPLNSPAAYFLFLLRNGHIQPDAVKKLSNTQKKKNAEVATQEKEQRAADLKRAKETIKLFDDLSENEQNRFIEEFRVAVVDHNPALTTAFRKEGINAMLIKKNFLIWWASNLALHGADTAVQPVENRCIDTVPKNLLKSARMTPILTQHQKGTSSRIEPTPAEQSC